MAMDIFSAMQTTFSGNQDRAMSHRSIHRLTQVIISCVPLGALYTCSAILSLFCTDATSSCSVPSFPFIFLCHILCAVVISYLYVVGC